MARTSRYDPTCEPCSNFTNFCSSRNASTCTGHTPRNSLMQVYLSSSYASPVLKPVLSGKFSQVTRIGVFVHPINSQ